MSVLDLLGISDESFDGRSIDKDIGAIEGLSSNKYAEDEIESANAALEEINYLVRKANKLHFRKTLNRQHLYDIGRMANLSNGW